MLDELEELDLVLNHYAITWGIKVVGATFSSAWPEWGMERRT